MGDDFWLTIKDVTGWDQPKMVHASQSIWTLIGGLKIRLVDCWDHFPYPLYEYDVMDEAGKDRVDGALYHCPADHLEPGIARPMVELHPTRAAFKRDVRLHRDVRFIGGCVPENNINCEDRFARQNCYDLANRGNPCNHHSIGHRHMLPEAMVLHRHCMDKLLRDIDQPARPRDTSGEKFRTAHLAFVTQYRREHPKTSVDDANLVWLGMSDARRAPYNRYVRQPGEVRPAVENPQAERDRKLATMGTRQSYMGIGCAQYPM